MSPANVRVERVYEAMAAGPTYQVLVDRLWPRGVRTGDARISLWLPAVAPSTELRKWFDHDPGRFEGFTARYMTEIEEGERSAAWAELRAIAVQHDLVLITATRDVAHSHAQVLCELLRAASAGT